LSGEKYQRDMLRFVLIK